MNLNVNLRLKYASLKREEYEIVPANLGEGCKGCAFQSGRECPHSLMMEEWDCIIGTKCFIFIRNSHE
jgi:hypothetical protein